MSLSGCCNEVAALQSDHSTDIPLHSVEKLAASLSLSLCCTPNCTPPSPHSWSKTPPRQRSAVLLKIANLVEQRLDEFAEVESRDQGKPVWLAKKIDIPRVCLNFRFFATGILHTIDM